MRLAEGARLPGITRSVPRNQHDQGLLAGGWGPARRGCTHSRGAAAGIAHCSPVSRPLSPSPVSAPCGLAGAWHAACAQSPDLTSVWEGLTWGPELATGRVRGGTRHCTPEVAWFCSTSPLEPPTSASRKGPSPSGGQALALVTASRMTRCGSGLCLCGARAQSASVRCPRESASLVSPAHTRIAATTAVTVQQATAPKSRGLCWARCPPRSRFSSERRTEGGERSLRQPRGGDALALALALAAAALTCSHLGFATCGQGAADRFSSQWFLLVVPTGTELCKCRRTGEGAVSSAPETSKRRRKHTGPGSRSGE